MALRRMNKLITAGIYETAKSIAWASYVSRLLARAMEKGAASFSALAQVIKKVKGE